MRIFLVLICSLALACIAGAQQEEKGKKKEQKKGPQAGQVSQPPGGKPAGAGKPTGAGMPTGVGKPAAVGKPTGAGKPTGVGKPAEVGKAKGAGKPTETGKPAEAGKPTGAGKPAEVGKAAGKGKPTETGKPAEVGKAAGKGKPTETTKPAEVGKATGAGKPVTTGAAAGKKYQAKQLTLPNKPKPEVAPAVTFQQNKRIEEAQNWSGPQYTAFRNYQSEWHDQGWWRQHYNRVVLISGGWYYWNAGFWFPAWGYDSANAYYPYDGPIYGYNNMPPDQVIANVQTALQEQGYYQGEVDGLLGPQTRAAIADYQRANGLTETAAIDEPTLSSLGMA